MENSKSHTINVLHTLTTLYLESMQILIDEWNQADDFNIGWAGGQKAACETFKSHLNIVCDIYNINIEEIYNGSQ